MTSREASALRSRPADFSFASTKRSSGCRTFASSEGESDGVAGVVTVLKAQWLLGSWASGEASAGQGSPWRTHSVRAAMALSGIFSSALGIGSMSFPLA